MRKTLGDGDNASRAARGSRRPFDRMTNRRVQTRWKEAGLPPPPPAGMKLIGRDYQGSAAHAVCCDRSPRMLRRVE